jgi:predicted DNA-binding transcriptional regulator AlpA
MHFELSDSELQGIAQQVAELIRQEEDGFLDVRSAADFLSLTPKAVYQLVARQQLPCHKPAGRLLFDRAELRTWVKGAAHERNAIAPRNILSVRCAGQENAPASASTLPGPDTEVISLCRG